MGHFPDAKHWLRLGRTQAHMEHLGRVLGNPCTMGAEDSFGISSCLWSSKFFIPSGVSISGHILPCILPSRLPITLYFCKFLFCFITVSILSSSAFFFTLYPPPTLCLPPPFAARSVLDQVAEPHSEMGICMQEVS